MNFILLFFIVLTIILVVSIALGIFLAYMVSRNVPLTEGPDELKKHPPINISNL